MKSILLGDKKEAVGVELEEGGHIYANTVLSNATAHLTFLKLLPEGVLPPQFEATIRGIDYSSPVCKINGTHHVVFYCVLKGYEWSLSSVSSAVVFVLWILLTFILYTIMMRPS